MEDKQPPKVCCPKCGSDQFTVNRKGFSALKSVGGAVLTGGIGLLAGFHGSKKIIITCLACAHNYKPGDVKQPAPVAAPKPAVTAPVKKEEPPELTPGCIFCSLIIAVFIYFVAS